MAVSRRSGCSRSMPPRGPTRRVRLRVSSRLPAPIFSSCGVIAMSLKPAPERIASTRFGSAKAKGPGAPGSGGGAGGNRWATEAMGRVMIGFWSGLRQHRKASRPPGFSARRRLLKAAVGSAKNMTPKRENRPS